MSSPHAPTLLFFLPQTPLSRTTPPYRHLPPPNASVPPCLVPRALVATSISTNISMQLALTKRVLQRATGIVCSAAGPTAKAAADSQALAAHALTSSLVGRGVHHVALPSLPESTSRQAQHNDWTSPKLPRELLRALRTLVCEQAEAFAVVLVLAAKGDKDNHTTNARRLDAATRALRASGCPGTVFFLSTDGDDTVGITCDTVQPTVASILAVLGRAVADCLCVAAMMADKLMADDPMYRLEILDAVSEELELIATLPAAPQLPRCGCRRSSIACRVGKTRASKPQAIALASSSSSTPSQTSTPSPVALTRANDNNNSSSSSSNNNNKIRAAMTIPSTTTIGCLCGTMCTDADKGYLEAAWKIAHSFKTTAQLVGGIRLLQVAEVVCEWLRPAVRGGAAPTMLLRSHTMEGIARLIREAVTLAGLVGDAAALFRK